MVIQDLEEIYSEPVSNVWQETTFELEVSKTLEHSKICQHFWSFLIKENRQEKEYK